MPTVHAVLTSNGQFMRRPASWCPISAILVLVVCLGADAAASANGTPTPELLMAQAGTAPARSQGAQAPPAVGTAPLTPGAVAPTDRVRVHVTCVPCDASALRTALPFVDLVTTAEGAEVVVTVGSRDVGTTREWRVAIAGRGRFADRSRAVLVPIAAAAPPADVSAQITRTIKLALAEFAADSGERGRLDVTYARPAGTPVPPHDRWNAWVFRLGAYSYGNGQESTFDGYYDVSASANRTTEEWKVRVSGNRGISRSSFKLDENETIKTRLGDWSADLLLVRSLGARLSAGLGGSMNGSTYSNTERVARVTPAIEFDFFPYSESSKRSLTVQYDVGVAHYDYAELTIFDRLKETVAQHGVGASLGLEQPWGSVGSEFQFMQQLSALDRTRVSVSGNFSVRLLRSFSLNGSASYTRIRDQFTLVKGDASVDEVLLRQRQLETGYRYSMSFGISYSFGALSNATVNPRFNN